MTNLLYIFSGICQPLNSLRNLRYSVTIVKCFGWPPLRRPWPWATGDTVTVSLFFFFNPTLLYFFISFSAFSMKRRSRTSCQLRALVLGNLVSVDRKKAIENFWRLSRLQLSKTIMEALARLAWRASRVWRRGRRRRTILACSTLPEGVQGETRKNTVLIKRKNTD